MTRNSNRSPLACRSAGLLKLKMSDLTSTTLISGFNGPNGLVIDDKGFAYLTGADAEVLRIDTTTGESTVLYEGQLTHDGIAFGPDYKTLYFNSESGPVYEMPINEDGTPGETSVLTTTEGKLDGMTMDECGNLYVVDMIGKIHRISKDGEAAVIVDITDNRLNAVSFGSGVGGWRRDALYMVSSAGAIYEILGLGVRGALLPNLK